MPIFEIFARYSSTVNRWDRLDDYNLVKSSANHWTLVYDEDDRGPFEADRQAYKIDLTIDDGLVTKLEYIDKQGREMAELRDISFDKDLVDILMSEEVDNGSDIFGLMIRPGTRFFGGDQESGQWDDRDYITTGFGRDIVKAFGGNDLITDVGGADIYNGGTGFDTITYQKWFLSNPDLVRNGLDADLAIGTIKGPDGRIDRVSSIEGIRGTFLDDRLGGDLNSNYFEGGRGVDVFKGRLGADMVGYSGDFDQGGSGGIVARLNVGFVIDGFGDRDKVFSIENVDGSDQNDRFIDNGQDNWFQGNDGDDVMVFSTGDDRADGGKGADRFVFVGSDTGVDVIEDFNASDGDRIRLVDVDHRGDLKSISVVDGDTVIAFDSQNRVIVEGFDENIASLLIYG